MPAAKPTPAEPRPSASLIVINDKNEILLVQRNPKARSFAGQYVFPGGNYDPKQDTSLAITAIRETFEESGLLLAKSAADSPPLSDAALDAARTAIHGQTLAFQTFLAQHSLAADVNALLPFTTWVTPPAQPRRFRTQFFLAFLAPSPSSPSAGAGAGAANFTSGTKSDRLPTPDGGQEVILAQFVHPADAIAHFKAGTIGMFPPQYYILDTLRPLLAGRRTTEAQRQRLAALSRSAFGALEINPKVTMVEGGDREARFFLYEGDELRGGAPGTIHRAECRLKNGVFADIELKRNFDLFTDIESVIPKPKL
ncbi:hypothetical protein CONPUDRAFT_97199 [Coniophora puteana RWD-64-598 SS2]|uniref:Nudix hydrolase domain-containing protein n=1 Tax=Coniophora puteana (strain RWD-64-598) TaxID=741705 RepID=A0A5M3N0R4_CONPW|nr:uncharacterized protein CONPUDRAFT_97199 [Coniophora puteana RWD-64-598 SS2]EIW84837.1 hypothetical protein CONPUDRAFT_97199 [Coniophora puteana RWD-64-598 SS2]